MEPKPWATHGPRACLVPCLCLPFSPDRYFIGGPVCSIKSPKLCCRHFQLEYAILFPPSVLGKPISIRCCYRAVISVPQQISVPQSVLWLQMLLMFSPLCQLISRLPPHQAVCSFRSTQARPKERIIKVSGKLTSSSHNLSLLYKFFSCGSFCNTFPSSPVNSLLFPLYEGLN